MLRVGIYTFCSFISFIAYDTIMHKGWYGVMELKKFRKLKNISQAQLAEAVNLSNSTIGNYEQGTREPDIQTLCLLADYFEISVDDLIGHVSARSEGLISDNELSLIADYRKLDTADRDRLKKIISALRNVADKEATEDKNSEVFRVD